MNNKQQKKRERFLKNQDKIKNKIINGKKNAYRNRARVFLVANITVFILMAVILYAIPNYIFNYVYALPEPLSKFQLYIEIAIAIALSAVFNKAKEQQLYDFVNWLFSPIHNYITKQSATADARLYMHNFATGNSPKYKYNKKKNKR